MKSKNEFIVRLEKKCKSFSGKSENNNPKLVYYSSHLHVITLFSKGPLDFFNDNKRNLGKVKTKPMQPLHYNYVGVRRRFAGALSGALLTLLADLLSLLAHVLLLLSCLCGSV